MSNVNMEMTESQYKKLTELVYLGNWLVNAHRNEEITHYEELEQFVYKNAGLADVVTYDEEEDFYSMAPEQEEKLHRYIKEYEDYNFWEELTYRLANRDLLRELGPKGKLEQKDIERRIELAEGYENEFIKNGLRNVTVNKTS
ncbi:hypothetical protein ERJ70_04260 [Sediminibacillus dalangtanensis]|uniref:Uncharacterized protein n=1 Tax=Sediminibacillus dalangtanensis TaxID=2729421 RepID=A0ABX7VW65_9BACI|nr:hypothetical protein [Sediminibacillus dalangtanensis]QTM98577.1 hypothetical protein ERJ70_04260 [Sediminibacillus dalangtanensis]